MDWSLPGSSVHGILQARILKWGCHSPLQGIFPMEGSNLYLLHSKWNLYHWATREAPNLNFLTSERWKCLLHRFAIRTEFDHTCKVLRSWRVTCFLSALLPLLYTHEVSKQTGSLQNFLNYRLLPSLKSCVQTIFLEIFNRVISSVQSLSHVWLFVMPWTAAHQASLSITNSRSLPKLMSIESVMSLSHLILCRPLLLPPSIFPSIRGFSNKSVLGIR